MSSSRRATISVSVIVLAICGFWVLATDAREPQPSASAEVIVMKRASRVEPSQQFQEDIIGTQTVLLKSRFMAERAVRHGKLDELLKVEQADAINILTSSMAVKRQTGDSHSANVLSLSIHNQPKPIAIAMLNAVLESHTVFLDEVYFDYHKAQLDELSRAQSKLTKRIDSAEREYDAFLKSMAEIGVANDPERINHRLTQVYKRLAEVDLSLTELDARIQHIQNLAEAKEMPLTLKNRIDEWATKSGLDKTQATSANLIAALKSDRAELQLQKKHLESVANQTIKDRSIIKSQEREEQRLRGARDRAVAMNSKLENLLQEASARMDNGGFRLFVVTKPH